MKHFIHYIALSILAMSGTDLIAYNLAFKNATDVIVRVSLKKQVPTCNTAFVDWVDKSVVLSPYDDPISINPGETVHKETTCCIVQMNVMIQPKKGSYVRPVESMGISRCGDNCSYTIKRGVAQNSLQIIEGIQ